MQYDGTVRQSSSDIIQFTYGDDNIEPTYSAFIFNNTSDFVD